MPVLTAPNSETVALFAVSPKDLPPGMLSDLDIKDIAQLGAGAVEVVVGMKRPCGEFVQAPGVSLDELEPTAGINLSQPGAQRLLSAYRAAALLLTPSISCSSFVDYTLGWRGTPGWREGELRPSFGSYISDTSASINPNALEDGRAYTFGDSDGGSHAVLGISDPTRCLSKFGYLGPVIIASNVILADAYGGRIAAISGRGEEPEKPTWQELLPMPVQRMFSRFFPA